MTERQLPELSKDGSTRVTDEKFNTASHLAAAIFAVLGCVILVVQASAAMKVWHIVSFSIYGLSLFLLFLASTLHHGIKSSPKMEALLRSFDYHAIFLLIAGTFTPMCLVVLRGPLGWSVLGVTWAVAITGIVLRAVFPQLPKWVSLTMYATMGWIAVVVVWPLLQALSWIGFGLLFLGGVLYTAGSVIFTSERPNPVPGTFGFHEIWHLFVILGALCHYLLMFFFVLPMP